MYLYILWHLTQQRKREEKEHTATYTHVCRKIEMETMKKISVCANRKRNDVNERERERERQQEKKPRELCVCTMPFLGRFRRFFEN